MMKDESRRGVQGQHRHTTQLLAAVAVELGQSSASEIKG